MTTLASDRPSILRPLAAAILVAALMTAVLGYQIERRAGILRSGTEVLLATEPVDPRDLLRGDYVVLSYPVSLVPFSEAKGARPMKAGRTVLWIRLAPGADGLWTRTEASFSELPPQDGTVVLKSLPFEIHGWEGEGDSYRADFGIERFYVPEGEGLEIEAARNDSRVTMAVRVAEDGRAQVRTLFIDGKPVYSDPLY
ncbi:GDYXXLXY domain-containing protein [Ciceribacter sp. L1K22]|uniref:GDYXXLXY domain-containing protein n=1 Tax=Ciceribacter sp. L1K22 TaxID=2820275 RepID=UPI001ABE4472|nr:GDYXXLXY domain-containing protein [Ciceribacter sp. L1K22]MBO3760082.1 GDYXXLXY domain-containing protein [Ciceribacter sp. L1K22]